ncbi:hypothetical protein IDJ77_23020 [Mucilaginibacter sp. ZT4R22]|uniref:Outer membrane protein with beta-barrel domain n=1 Tax=Mucilaginibacter pankratovii TaxID=2772110 RepID=A0ABR7WWN9_9SPHI|nr:hypothetical protein [Mucilaginibacter pankratovii]MBD1366702.1 hypothetical protein [Mucilaginibacter pankratovii]
MKYKLLFVSLIFSCKLTFSQTVDKTIYDNVYTFITSETLLKCSGKGVDIAGSAEDIPTGTEFKVTKILDDGNFVIQFLIWNPDGADAAETTKRKNLNTKYVSSTTDQTTGKAGATDRYFKLPLKVFVNSCDKRLNRHSFTLGALVLPIKLRFGGETSDANHHRDFTFANDISIGLSIGYKYSPSKKYSHNFLTGIALTSIGVTPGNTKSTVTSETNLAAITWHLGYLFQIDNFQIGAFTGIDYLGGNVGRNWDYKGKPWFGIGLGYSIFKSKSTSDTQP